MGLITLWHSDFYFLTQAYLHVPQTCTVHVAGDANLLVHRFQVQTSRVSTCCFALFPLPHPKMGCLQSRTR